MLDSMMKSISNRLNLSHKYTNHCLRSTTVHLLLSKGVPSRQIMRTTNHKCESSLKVYDSENTVAQKRKISNLLSDHVVVKEPCISTITGEIDCSEISTISVPTATMSSTTSTACQYVFSGSFQNCTFQLNK